MVTGHLSLIMLMSRLRGKHAIFEQNASLSRKRSKLLPMTRLIRSYMRFRLAPRSMTLDDLELL